MVLMSLRLPAQQLGAERVQGDDVHAGGHGGREHSRRPGFRRCGPFLGRTRTASRMQIRGFMNRVRSARPGTKRLMDHLAFLDHAEVVLHADGDLGHPVMLGHRDVDHQVALQDFRVHGNALDAFPLDGGFAEAVAVEEHDLAPSSRTAAGMPLDTYVLAA